MKYIVEIRRYLIDCGFNQTEGPLDYNADHVGIGWINVREGGNGVIV